MKTWIRWPRCAWASLAAGIAAVVMPVASAGALELSQYGPRLGFGVDPDQITVGVFADWGEMAPELHLRTSSDLGFGDHVFTFVVNGDVTYHFVTTSSVGPYLGAGLAFAFYDFDVPEVAGVKIDDTHNEIGLNLVAGIEKQLGGYKTGALELRIGIDDLPDLKVTAQLGFF